MRTMDLSLFDLDNTLLAGDSDFEWAQFLIEQGVLDAEVYSARNAAFYAQYRNGTLDINEFLEFQLRPLARHQRSELERWQALFVQTRIMPLVRAPALELVRQHQQSGALCAIVTATNSFVTAPIARLFDIAHLIATVPAQQDGRFTGAPRGLPAFREGKIARTESWLESLGLHWSSFSRVWFYSDSLNDLPLLNRVTHPVAVDPDETLAAHAKLHGWPIVALHSAATDASC